MSRVSSKTFLTAWLIAMALSLPAFGAAQSKSPASWTEKDLKQTIAIAKTADDYARIAQYYRFDASRLGAESRQHAAFAAKYGSRTGRHCRWLATQYAKQEHRALHLAQVQEGMTKSLEQRLRKSPVRR